MRLPTVYDSTAGEAHRATIELMLYAPQAKALGARAVMNAVAFFVDRDGIELWLLRGRVREHPERWPQAFDALGLSGQYDGMPALAALKAICLWLQQRKRPHGVRGPGRKDLDARDYLLSAVLVRIAKGESMRRAVCDVLAAYEEVTPWPFATAENTLLTVVKRHLRARRSFVPSPSDRVR